MRDLLAAAVATVAMSSLVACGRGGGAASQPAPPPTEPAAGIEVMVRPTAVGDRLRYAVEVRNTTDRSVRALRLDTGAYQRLGPEAGLVTIVHRHGQGRGGDEAPPSFRALVVGPSQSVSMESNGTIPLGGETRLVRVCIEVEDLPGSSTSLTNGADTQIVVTDPRRPVRLACSEPVPPASA